jgi:glycosyltransferase involved in cell wall biosynthesis
MISVVVPLYNEEESLRELYRRLRASLSDSGLVYEIIFVNDGSYDETPSLIDELANQDRQVVALHFSRNFGHQAAVSAGLDHARGECVVLIDGDLQDPPELLGAMIERWREGFEVVFAVRRRREEAWPKRLGYFAFYRLLNAISDVDIPLDSGDFCLMDRKVVDVLVHLPEKMRFMRGLRSFVGFKQVGLEYDRPARGAGSPKYNLRRLIALAVDGLISFSGRPLRLVTYLGLAAIGVATALSTWIFHDALAYGKSPAGWASSAVIVLFMGSVQLLSLGIIGEYIRLIFLEVKGRPTYIVRDRPVRKKDDREDCLP